MEPSQNTPPPNESSVEERKELSAFSRTRSAYRSPMHSYTPLCRVNHRLLPFSQSSQLAYRYAQVVQEILGHSQISMTMDIYSHVLPTMQQEAIGKLNTVLQG